MSTPPSAALIARELGRRPPWERATFLHELMAHSAAALVIVKGEAEAAEDIYRLADHVVARGGPAETMRWIACEVADRHGISVDLLRGRRHRAGFAAARAEAMWRMRQVRGRRGTRRYSLPTIGAFMGGRHHTTVLHHVRRYEGREAS